MERKRNAVFYDHCVIRSDVTIFFLLDRKRNENRIAGNTFRMIYICIYARHKTSNFHIHFGQLITWKLRYD